MWRFFIHDTLDSEGLYFVLATSFHQWGSQLKFCIRGMVTALDRYWYINEEILESASAFTGTCVWSKSFCGSLNSVVDHCDLPFTESEIALICHYCLLEVSIKFWGILSLKSNL